MQTSEDDVTGAPRVNAFRFLLGRLKEHPLARVGPGLITGVADDDPSGIATYSQAGAQFGLNMLWTMPLAYPLMSAIQSMCARIGRVTGKGLAANIKSTFPPVTCVFLGRPRLQAGPGCGVPALRRTLDTVLAGVGSQDYLGKLVGDTAARSSAGFP
jgi:Natural resistance-associated macrophage protein